MHNTNLVLKWRNPFQEIRRAAAGLLALGFLACGSDSFASGEVLSLGGGPRNNSTAYGFVNGLTRESRFNGPFGLALNSQGELFVADKTNNAIRRITRPGDTNNSETFTYISNLSSVVGAVFDSANNIYVICQGDKRLRKFNSEWPPKLVMDQRLPSMPTALALRNSQTNTDIYITMTNGVLVKMVQVFSTNTPGGVLTNTAATNNVTTELIQPRGVAVLPDGKLAVTEANKISIVDPGFGSKITHSGSTQGYYEGTWTVAKFNQPRGIAATPDGKLIVADWGNNRVRLVDTEGTTSLIYGTDSSLWTGFYRGWTDGEGCPDAECAEGRSPTAVLLSPEGTIYVTETYWHTVRQVTGAGVSPTVEPPTKPTFGPTCGYYPQGVFVWVTNEFGNVYYTTDGTEPTLSSDKVSMTNGIGNIWWAYSDRDLGSLKLKAFNGFVGSDVVQGENCAPSTPTFGPVCGFFPGSHTVWVTNQVGTVFYTLNGSEPTPATSDYVRMTNGVGCFQWPNQPHEMSSLRLKSYSGVTNFSETVYGESCFPTTPTFWPKCGYFTNTSTVWVTNKSGTVFYTTNGTEPSPSSDYVIMTNGVGTIRWTGQHDMVNLRLKSYTGFVDYSPTVSGEYCQVTTPAYGPLCGYFTNAHTVWITNQVGDVYYDLDGNEPLFNVSPTVRLFDGVGSIYWTNNLPHDMTKLRLKAFSGPYNFSPTVAGIRCILTAPTFSPQCGYYRECNTVTISNTFGIVRYTLDGSEPSVSSPVVPMSSGVGQIVWCGPHDMRDLRLKSFDAAGNPGPTVGGESDRCIPSVPTFSPRCGYFTNSHMVTVSNTTGTVYYSLDGSEPTVNSAMVQIENGVGYILWTNVPHDMSLLRLKAFTGLNSFSPTIGGQVCPVSMPTISPFCGYYTNNVTVTVSNQTGKVYYTLDGSEPNLTSSPMVTMFNGYGTIVITNVPYDLSNLRLKSFDGPYNFSPTVIGQICPVTTPTFGPVCGYFTNCMTVTVTNSKGTVHFTLDGTEPTMQSSTVLMSQGVGSFQWCGAHDMSSLRLKAFDGPENFSPTVSGELCDPSTPAFWPTWGYYPSGQTIWVTNQTGQVYYTTDGSEPTTNSPTTSFRVPMTNGVGSFVWREGLRDLRSLKLKAFHGGSASATVSGIVSPANTIGFASDVIGGVGSTPVIPVVVNLVSNQVIRSLQLRIEITPESAGTLPIAAGFEYLPVEANQFVPLARPSSTNSVNLTPVYYWTNANETRGLKLSALGADSGLLLKDFAALCLLKVPIPALAENGQSYRLEVSNISASTTDSTNGSTGVIISALPSRRLTVHNQEWLIGDIAPTATMPKGRWYMAGDFGGGDLDITDVEDARYAALGVRVPFVFSDVFNAMDVFPLDEDGSPGGDRLLLYLDWQVIQDRSLRRDPVNWMRSWSFDGRKTNRMVSLPSPSVLRPQAVGSATVASAPGSVWVRQATVSGAVVTNVYPGATCDIPVKILVDGGCTLAGLQFRATVVPSPEAPAVANLQFVPAISLDRPAELVDGNALICTWSLNTVLMSNKMLLGSVRFTVPSAARAGQCYTVQFSHVDGAPDLRTQYFLDSIPGTAWVLSAADSSRSNTSEDWKACFFGTASNSLAADWADPDQDGFSNWQEYLAGTHPNDAQSRLQFSQTEWTNSPLRGVALRWLSAPGKKYNVEESPLLNGTWTPVATNILGDGFMRELIQTNLNGPAKFYRVRIQP